MRISGGPEIASGTPDLRNACVSRGRALPFAQIARPDKLATAAPNGALLQACPVSRTTDLRQPNPRKRTPRAAPVPAEAMRLLGHWNRIANGHVAMSAGCSCGVGVSELKVQDFESDILDFLRGRHKGLDDIGSISDLLRSLARQEMSADGDLIADVSRSLASFEDQHSGR